MALHFVIPGEPTRWQRAATFTNPRTGKLVHANPKGMREKQEAIAWACRAAMQGAPPMTGPLKLEILCVYAVPPSWPLAKREAALAGHVWKTSAPDYDNLAKQVGDALNKVAYVDDAQIVRSSVGKRYGHPQRTEVRLTRVDGLCDHSTNQAFAEWAQVNGSRAAVKAAAAWLAKRVGQPTLPGFDTQARNTLNPKRPGRA